jgi:hypothetical protein
LIGLLANPDGPQKQLAQSINHFLIATIVQNQIQGFAVFSEEKAGIKNKPGQCQKKICRQLPLHWLTLPAGFSLWLYSIPPNPFFFGLEINFLIFKSPGLWAS